MDNVYTDDLNISPEMRKYLDSLVSTLGLAKPSHQTEVINIVNDEDGLNITKSN